MAYTDTLQRTWRDNILFSVLVELTYRCNLNCFFCYNDPHLRGVPLTTDQYVRFFEDLCELGTLNLTFSGGEPFLQARALAEIGVAAKRRGFSIFTYTGFVFEQLMGQAETDPDIAALMAVTDVLVDGPFILEQRDIGLAFRGSANQRLLDLPASILQGQPVEWHDPVWNSY